MDSIIGFLTAIKASVTSIRSKGEGEKLHQYLRYILFHLSLYWYEYFNPYNFLGSWRIIWFIVSYGIRPAFGCLCWLTRKHDLGEFQLKMDSVATTVTSVTSIRYKRKGEKLHQYLRYILFHLSLYWYEYFNPYNFLESWRVIWFIISYGIRLPLGCLCWLLRKGKLEFLIKRCAQSSTKGIEDRVMDTLTNDMADESIQPVVRPWDRAQDEGHRPIIVFCVISSRIGTDIENAMRGVHGNSRVILVLLHCVLSSLLRGDLSDDEELLDPTMINRMAGIAHFAFSDREGLYECQQNRVGFRKLCAIATCVLE